MHPRNVFQQFAPAYRAKGLPVIPCHPKQKRPIEKGWSRFCSEMPSDEVFTRQLRDYPNANIGLPLGEQSKLIAVDIDLDTANPEQLAIIKQIMSLLPPTDVIKYARKGLTPFYQFDGTKNEKLDYMGKRAVEFLGHGNQTILPGSIHPEGMEYTWEDESKTLLNTSAEELPKLTEEHIQKIREYLSSFEEKPKRASHHTSSETKGKIKVGGRNSYLAREAGRLRSVGYRGEELENLLLVINENDLELPLDELEVRAIAKSISKYSSTADWGPLTEIPKDFMKVEEMPMFLVPEPLKGFVTEAVRSTVVRIEMIFAPLICALGAALSTKVAAYPKGLDHHWKVFTNLWGYDCAPSGSRKSQSLSIAFTGIFSLEKFFQERTKDQEKSLEESRQNKQIEIELQEAELNRLKKLKTPDLTEIRKQSERLRSLQEDKKNLAPLVRRILINDSSVEALQEIQAKIKDGLIWFRDELNGLFRSFEKSGAETHRAYLLEAWVGGNSYSTDRIARGSLYIPSNTLSIFGGIQPGVLGQMVESLSRPGGFDDGLLQRFQIAVFPERPPEYKTSSIPIDQTQFEIIKEITKKFASIGNGGWLKGQKDETTGAVKFVFDSDAQIIFNEWLEKHLNDLGSEKYDELQVLSSHFGKYNSTLVALALIHEMILNYAHDRARTKISVESIQWAIAFVDYLKQHAYKIYSYEAHRDLHAARKILRKIKEGEIIDGMPIRTLHRKQWSGLTELSTIEAGLSRLEELNWLRIEYAPTPGRSAEVIRLHPEAIKMTITKTKIDLGCTETEVIH